MSRSDQIDIARRLIATGISKDLEEVLEQQFPELAESEDEKIRKELIEQVQFIIPEEDECDEYGIELPCYQERIAKYVAYLEKLRDFQFDYPGLYFYDGEKLHFQSNPAMEEKQKPIEEGEDERIIMTLYYLVRDHDWLNGATKKEALAWLEKQKEQKDFQAKVEKGWNIYGINCPMPIKWRRVTAHQRNGKLLEHIWNLK